MKTTIILKQTVQWYPEDTDNEGSQIKIQKQKRNTNKEKKTL